MYEKAVTFEGIGTYGVVTLFFDLSILIVASSLLFLFNGVFGASFLLLLLFSPILKLKIFLFC